MSSIWGNRIKISVFGESHSDAIGGVFDGIPSGIKLDLDEINKEMKRRAPGNSSISTPRKEEDQVEILSGFFNGYTTGTPLSFIVRNHNKRSKDYDALKDLMRPGHGDYTGRVRYAGYNDYRGGGHFSGRITAPLVFMGAIAQQYIKDKKHIEIVSRIKSIGPYTDAIIDMTKGWDAKMVTSLKSKRIPTINSDVGLQMEKYIIDAKTQGDSVGGIIQCLCTNVPQGLGSPFFQSFESSLSQLLFSVPAVKGIEFGDGFGITQLKGSQANDEMYYSNEKVQCYTNHNGGILGGITNGMPIVFNVAIKPTPSISISQKTVNIKEKRDESLNITGRHDPCILPRAVPVIESCAALVIIDYLLQMEGI
ncbi:MAG: chorismate synthase [Eubacteriales bacterium]